MSSSGKMYNIGPVSGNDSLHTQICGNHVEVVDVLPQFRSEVISKCFSSKICHLNIQGPYCYSLRNSDTFIINHSSSV